MASFETAAESRSKLRHKGGAGLKSIRATWREGAARAKLLQVRRLTRYGDKTFLCFLIKSRHRQKQALSIGMLGLIKDDFRRSLFGNSATIHDHDLIAESCDYAKIMGDHSDACANFFS